MPSQWILNGNKSFDGKCHHKPDGHETKDATHVGKRLTIARLVVDGDVVQTQPFDECDEEETCVADAQCGQIIAGRLFAKVCEEED